MLDGWPEQAIILKGSRMEVAQIGVGRDLGVELDDLRLSHDGGTYAIRGGGHSNFSARSQRPQPTPSYNQGISYTVASDQVEQ